MSQMIIGTRGRFGILKQAAFDTPQVLDANFHYFPFTSCDYGPVDATAALPLEAGGPALIRSMYKTGAIFAGGLNLVPRLDNRFGWLLEAAVGDASTFADMTIAQHIAGAGTNVGCYTHQFLFTSASLGTTWGDQFELPYLTTHRYLPSQTSGDDVGEISQDACVTSLVLDVGAAGIAGAQVGFLGRAKGTTLWDINPGWSLPSYDDTDAFITSSCSGSVQITVNGGVPGTLATLNATRATLNLTNMLLPPQRARVIGSPYQVDHPNLGRSATIQIPFLVADYDVYVQSFGGPANPVTDTGWSCVPLDGNVDISLQSADLIPGTATAAYYQLRFRTINNNCKWSFRPLTLVPGMPVVMALVGTIADDGTEVPFELYIQNDLASYT